MQSIGERLEEARKRKGISLREAAEATKIRSDFLGYIETNKMDFDLPEIYKRGFLKNYARYLKLDVDKIMADYSAQQPSNSRLAKKGGAEWFGQLEAKKATSESTEAHAERDERDELEGHKEPARYGRIAPKSTPPREDETEISDEEGEEADKTFYIKIGLIFVGTLALVFVVFGLIWAILGSSDSDEEANNADLRTPAEAAQVADTAQPAANTNSITLIASGNVYVLVKQQSDNKELYRKTMSAGESVSLEKEGAVDILFTAGENILIEAGGERLRPSSSGTAKITIQ
ncbi:helix-turn-helix domain-containing protein [Coraliomargarita sp. SDUM461004]|uniref:Helix-turn-helix domain-containing protein n=1 Tax=Thalassobacterium sedimentorum TaxID=3041258 RepID=A0ABU1AJ43_9BACT|nr:helix-turn-helix domain-containing protein [Coraliomargarita sp. SDUM461004]MDQ8194844.1 helix-turn-helix domain-containing protein [Coraliomargarita sp. SDUM461004]